MYIQSKNRENQQSHRTSFYKEFIFNTQISSDSGFVVGDVLAITYAGMLWPIIERQ